ncbi:MAG: GNAT family N-acetyltransferase [Saprospiraceae bacterium]|nr:GNAT family N-acetyltransferase [Pyrinomonadaceae bacterium]
MGIEIRNATEEDCPEIVGLMRDFAEFEKLGQYCEITADKLSAAMFRDGAFVNGIVALDGGTMIAYALFYKCFASFRGQCGVYLEDIFIDDKYRGFGVGETIIRMISREARLQGAERIDFQVLDWNAQAIRFYEKLGAVSNQDETHFKISGEAFEKLAG